MPSLLDIGKSAVNAQRNALNVTGQNIANVNTEGYRRRDASMLEVSGRATLLQNQLRLIKTLAKCDGPSTLTLPKHHYGREQI